MERPWHGGVQEGRAMTGPNHYLTEPAAVEHFPAFVGIAASLIGYRRLATLLKA
ncbi:hypothetical protein ACFCZQ_32020 [Streptomyces virginiae]|uniref:hypothetical protein n=1 Tax=Streptomyces virginiae TaxID=1961 RepID=UPI0035E1DA8A